MAYSANFYAVRDDIAAFLEHATTDLGLEIFEVNSEYDRPLRRFATPDAAITELDLGVDPYGLGTAQQLGLWAPRFGPEPLVERMRLKVKGNPTREFLRGWGIIGAQFGGVHDRTITASTFGVNSQARARKWAEAAYDELGPADAWNWDAVSGAARKLRYHVSRRAAVGKTKPPVVHYVLRHADELRRGGYGLVDGARRPVQLA